MALRVLIAGRIIMQPYPECRLRQQVEWVRDTRDSARREPPGV